MLGPGHYSFNANAIGLGGVITPKASKRRVIPSLASVALAPTGGEGWSTVEAYNEDGVAFTRAQTHVIGTSRGNVHSTRADVWITNLDLFGELHIDSLRASVISVREVVGSDVIDREFTFQADYLGVLANGVDTDICLDTSPFDNNPSYEGFVNALAKPEMAEYRALIGISPTTSLVASTSSAPTICCTALDPRKPLSSGVAIRVNKLGVVHFAEALVKPGQRRLTLLRLELDPPEPDAAPLSGTVMMMKLAPGGDGAMSVGSVEGNGTHSIP
jgi:hypothetical protein